MPSYPIPDLDQQHRRLLALRGAIMPEADTSPGGTFWRDDRVTAAAVTDIHAHVHAVDRDASPFTAEGEALEARWGTLRAVPRKGATVSQRAQAMEVRGIAGAQVSAGDILVERKTGLEVQLTAAETIGAAGAALCDVQSIDTGARVNFAAGTAFDFRSPPAGINQQAKLVLPMQGGLDAEQEGAYRGRIISRFQRPPQGGNRNDYAQWALEVEGVDTAYALPERTGVGAVDLVVLRTGRGANRLLTAAERQTVHDHVLARRPIGATIRVLEVTTATVDAEVQITPLADQRYQFDWDDLGAGLTIQTYDSTTRLITTTGALPDSFRAGVRLVIDHGSLGGQVLLAQALTASNAFVLALPDEAIPFTPSPGDTIYAAGPLTQPIRDAILTGYAASDGSPIPGIDSLGPANEASRYGAWIDTVERPRLASAALAVAGVYRATVPGLALAGTELAGDVARPADPAAAIGALPDETTTIGILTAGQILVRRAP